MKILIDAMGGDNAPQAPVLGALDAIKEYSDLSVTLVGDERLIRAAAQEAGRSGELDSIEIVHTDSVINMEDDALSVAPTG